MQRCKAITKTVDVRATEVGAVMSCKFKTKMHDVSSGNDVPATLFEVVSFSAERMP